MKNKTRGALLCLCMAQTLCGCYADDGNQADTSGQEFSEALNGKMIVEALDVGKADSILIRTQNHNVLIDTATSKEGSEIRDYLTELGIEKLDYLIITHFDKDHVGGASKILKSIGADNILQPDYEGNTDAYEKYMQRVTELSLNQITLFEDLSFILDDVYFTVYPPEKKEYIEEDNDFSLVVTAIHGGNRFLFTGDAEKERVNEIISYNLGDFDYIKVPHHGVYEDNLPVLFNTVKAEYAVICDSDKEQADKLTINALEKAGASVYETRDGSVTAVSDGKSISLTTEKNISVR